MKFYIENTSKQIIHISVKQTHREIQYKITNTSFYFMPLNQCAGTSGLSIYQK